MAIAECSIDFDDSWIQEGCHWKYERFFNFTWTTNETTFSEIQRCKLYFRIGGYSENTSDYTQISSDYYTKKTSGNVTTYSYTLPFSALSDDDLKKLYTEGKITAYMVVTYTYAIVFTQEATASYEFPYSLELAPEGPDTSSIKIKKFSSKKIRCTWDPATGSPADLDAGSDPSPVSGYCVELLRCPAGSATFSNVDCLVLEERSGAQWLSRDVSLAIPECKCDAEQTFYGPISTEVYLLGEDSTTIYFNPVELGFTRKDTFKFIIRPFTVYNNNYAGALEGALLGNAGVESAVEDVITGVMRVKTADGWRGGITWVKTENGWKEASGIYIKTDKGWKESV
jgi:hypothetical protein